MTSRQFTVVLINDNECIPSPFVDFVGIFMLQYTKHTYLKYKKFPLIKNWGKNFLSYALMQQIFSISCSFVPSNFHSSSTFKYFEWSRFKCASHFLRIISCSQKIDGHLTIWKRQDSSWLYQEINNEWNHWKWIESLH